MAESPPKEVDFLAGYSKNREENYEIKYLRKVLGQVDSRIQVPKSIDASSLRALIDDIPAPREIARRSARPRLLSLQSAVVYAAAFALIVGLYYSARMYKPELIDGVMEISQQEKSSGASIAVVDGADDMGDDFEQLADSILLAEAEPVEPLSQNQQADDGQGTETMEPVAQEDAPNAFSGEIPENVGGGGISTLLLEQDGLQYRERRNDMTDPDNPSPVTFEIFNSETQELVAQVNIPDTQTLVSCLVSDGMAVLIGHGEETVSISIYDVTSNPSNPDMLYNTTVTGSFADAQIYGDTAYIATVADETPDGVAASEDLPNATSDEACAFTAINLFTLEASQKAFTGANGMVQLSGSDAYIHYSGEADNGDTETYITRIILDGTDIIMGSGR